MLLNVTEYHRPADLGEAIALLRRGDRPSAVLAGGTELAGRQDDRLEALIDLSRLGLAGIRAEERSIRIGAMTTLKAIEQDPLIHQTAGGLLARAATLAAPATIRAAATLGGTLAGAKGGIEMPTALLALGATVTVASPEPVEYELDAILRSGVPKGLIITEVAFPRWRNAGGGLARVSRAPAERAIVFAAAVAPRDADGRPAVRAALGGVAAHPRTVDHSDPAAALAGWEAAGDFRGSAEYRRTVGPVLVRRAVAEALGEGGDGQ